METDDKQDPETQWCLVGNIVEERPFGPDGDETVLGTKHFSPKTKVYCFPLQWGDGFDQIAVIGRHRGSKKFVTMIIGSDSVENWRAKVVYNPEVLRRLQQSDKRNWISQEEVETFLELIQKNRE